MILWRTNNNYAKISKNLVYCKRFHGYGDVHVMKTGLTATLYFIKQLEKSRGVDGDADIAEKESIHDLVTQPDSNRNRSNRHQMLSQTVFVRGGILR